MIPYFQFFWSTTRTQTTAPQKALIYLSDSVALSPIAAFTKQFNIPGRIATPF